MGSECMNLPVIDLSNLKQGTPGWQTAKTRVVEALQEIGVFEARFDEIPRTLGEAVVAGMQEMFDLPSEVKLRNKGDKPHRGYGVPKTKDTLLESLGLMDVNLPGKLDAFTNLLWPDGNPPFRDNLLSMVEKLVKMDSMIRSMVVEGLGVEKYMDDHLDSTEYMVRFQKYDAPHTQEAKLGLFTHTDKNYITILYQNEVRGLDVQTKEGRWFTPEPSPNSCIVFIGDSYHAWTNGRLHSTNHRVMVNGDEERYSVGLFASPKGGYVVKAPEELVDEEHPLLFKPFDFYKFLEEADVAVPGALKKYCGV